MPEPDRPVMQISAFRGSRTVTSLRLCSRAPWTTSSSAGIAREVYLANICSSSDGQPASGRRKQRYSRVSPDLGLHIGFTHVRVKLIDVAQGAASSVRLLALAHSGLRRRRGAGLGGAAAGRSAADGTVSRRRLQRLRRTTSTSPGSARRPCSPANSCASTAPRPTARAIDAEAPGEGNGDRDRDGDAAAACRTTPSPRSATCSGSHGTATSGDSPRRCGPSAARQDAATRTSRPQRCDR